LLVLSHTGQSIDQEGILRPPGGARLRNAVQYGLSMAKRAVAALDGSTVE
jgi:hypothetical protein